MLDQPDFVNPNDPTRRMWGGRLSIPALSQALAQSGQSPRTQPFFPNLPVEIQDLFRQAYAGWNGPGRMGSADTGYETNTMPFRSILASKQFQGLDQGQQGQVIDIGQAAQTGSVPGLVGALSQPRAPRPSPAPAPQPAVAPVDTGGGVAAPPAPSPSPAPAPAPADPYAAWGGYQNYLLWLLGMGNEPSGGADAGGADTGGGGADAGGAGGAGGF